jgi:hypothetical protein
MHSEHVNNSEHENLERRHSSERRHHSEQPDDSNRVGNSERRAGSDRRFEHLSRGRLVKIIEEKRQMFEAEQVHIRGCLACRHELDKLVRGHETRLAQYQKWAPVTILIALVVACFVFLTLILKTL